MKFNILRDRPLMIKKFLQGNIHTHDFSNETALNKLMVMIELKRIHWQNYHITPGPLQKKSTISLAGNILVHCEF